MGGLIETITGTKQTELVSSTNDSYLTNAVQKEEMHKISVSLSEAAKMEFKKTMDFYNIVQFFQLNCIERLLLKMRKSTKKVVIPKNDRYNIISLLVVNIYASIINLLNAENPVGKTYVITRPDDNIQLENFEDFEQLKTIDMLNKTKIQPIDLLIFVNQQAPVKFHTYNVLELSFDIKKSFNLFLYGQNIKGEQCEIQGQYRHAFRTELIDLKTNDDFLTRNLDFSDQFQLYPQDYYPGELNVGMTESDYSEIAPMQLPNYDIKIDDHANLYFFDKNTQQIKAAIERKKIDKACKEMSMLVTKLGIDYKDQEKDKQNQPLYLAVYPIIERYFQDLAFSREPGFIQYFVYRLRLYFVKLDYDVEKKDPYAAVVTNGICYNKKMEEEADVPIDVKNVYYLKLGYWDVLKFEFLRSFGLYIKTILSLEIFYHHRKYETDGQSNIDWVYLASGKLQIKPYAGKTQIKYSPQQDLKILSDKQLVVHYEQIPSVISRLWSKVFDINDELAETNMRHNHKVKEIVEQIDHFILFHCKLHKYIPNAIKIPSQLESLFNLGPNDTLSNDCLTLRLHMYRMCLNFYRAQHEYLGVSYLNAHNKITLKKVVSNLLNIYVLQNTYIKHIPCNCSPKILMTIIPQPIEQTDSAIIYNNCIRTTVASFKRQCKFVPMPDPKIMKEYYNFCDLLFEEVYKPCLINFDYSYNQWITKEPLKKQRDLLTKDIQYRREHVEDKTCKMVVHELFCKVEKQEPGGKNRAIAGVDTFIKLVMGPITWVLEHLFNDNTHFYCGHKNADDYSKIYTDMHKKSFMAVEGDGSGFDQTQHYWLKYLDRKIYNYIAENTPIYHLDGSNQAEFFRNISTTAIKKLCANYYAHKKKITLCNSEILGTVFSGSTDTTLMNTVRMSSYNLFTLYKFGYLKKEQLKDYVGLHKGDDFVEFLSLNEEQKKQIVEDYYKIWVKKENASKVYIYGIGQIIKILEVLPPTRSSFCSCITLKTSDDKVVFVRDPQRMVRFAPYSRKFAYLNDGQKKQYLIDQAVALEAAQLDSVPFFKAFMELYYAAANRLQSKPSPLKEGDRKIKEYTEQDEEMDKKKHKWIKSREDEYRKYDYDRDYMYARIKNDRKEKFKLDMVDYYDNMQQRYKWSKHQIEDFIYFLRNCYSNSKLLSKHYGMIDQNLNFDW